MSTDTKLGVCARSDTCAYCGCNFTASVRLVRSNGEVICAPCFLPLPRFKKAPVRPIQPRERLGEVGEAPCPSGRVKRGVTALYGPLGKYRFSNLPIGG